MLKLSGKRAVVLGAAGRDNMGQVIARRFVQEGAKVLVAGRHADALEAFAKDVNGSWAIADITSKQSVDALATEAVRQLGGIDIAVNCAGLGVGKPFLDVDEDHLRQMMELQFKGPFQFFQAIIRAMTSGGSIIQISSATATIMLDDFAAYQGTKAGIDHVVRCVANQFGKQGIRLNSISPGLTDTPMNAGAMATPGLIEAFVPSYPLGRIGTSQDIAAAAVWLASDECFMTGQNLQVNGGLTLRRNPTTGEIMESIGRATAPSGTAV